MIYILTGAIRSGKTTALLNWSNQRDDVEGWLCPDDENGRRCFQNVKSKMKFELESKSELENREIVEIGTFQFLKSAFDNANNHLMLMASEMKSQYIILDELGRLELGNQGLHASADKLIPEFLNDEKRHLILVVRNYLLSDIVNYYNISEFKILSNEDLKSFDSIC